LLLLANVCAIFITKMYSPCEGAKTPILAFKFGGSER
jgi:hypothetical protein